MKTKDSPKSRRKIGSQVNGNQQLAPFAGLFWVLKKGAPENPTAAGAAAGLAAGAIAAAIYAWRCPDDSPLFLAAWYTAAIAGVTAMGALLGRRWLRW